MTTAADARRPFQFRLGTLVWGVSLAGIALGIARWLGWESTPFVVAGILVWVLAGSKMRHFLVWMAPLLYAACAYGSYRYPGDEYGMFLVSALPALWLTPFIQIGHLDDVVWLLIAGGAVPLTGLGFALDRLKVPRRAWAFCYVATTACLLPWGLSQYESLERAISKNGSIQAYFYSGANLALYLSLLVFLAIGIVAAVYRRIARRKKSAPAAG